MTDTNIRLLILQHLAHEDAGSILAWAAANNLGVKTLLVPALAGPYPAMDTFDCLLILGGVMGVYEEESYPWMIKGKAFIRQAIATGKTVIGICLGSQLLAEALGANVYPHTKKEIGFFPVYKTGEAKAESALDVLPETWFVFHWHGDTFDLPKGATPLFYSDACASQAFRKGKCWGFQFHPEINGKLLGDMIAFDRNELAPAAFVQTENEIRSAFTQYNDKHFSQLLDCILK